MEIEAKIPVKDLDALYERLLREADKTILDHAFEQNFRFDTVDERLSGLHQVLRLRSCGGETILTWKGPGSSTANLAVREEIETRLSDGAASCDILTRLGFFIVFRYEKIRGEFYWRSVSVMLDETPMGCFVEIEGENEPQIQRAALDLGLDYSQSVSESYQKLWRNWCRLHPEDDPKAMVFKKEMG